MTKLFGVLKHIETVNRPATQVLTSADKGIQEKDMQPFKSMTEDAHHLQTTVNFVLASQQEQKHKEKAR